MLVTGGGGIGEATARVAAEGAKVVHGRDRGRAEAVAAGIGASGGAIGDLSDEGRIRAARSGGGERRRR